MFKRVLCVIVSCVLAFSVLTLPVSANVTEIPDNFDYFLSNFRGYYEDYKSGNLTWGAFVEKTLAEARKLGLNNMTAINGYKDLITLFKSLGVDVDDFWTDFYYDRNGGSSDDSILKGYGAVCVHYQFGSLHRTVSGSYGIIFTNRQNQIVVFADSEKPGLDQFEGKSSDSFTSNVTCGYIGDHVANSYIFYGDWRYEDGSPATDNITDFPDKEVPHYDDDSIPEDDLIDFLEDLLNKLSLQFPDLSTVEGLLAAILAQLQSINGKMDDLHVTVDNLSEVKTYLDMAIASIIANGSSSDNSAVVDELVKIREAIKEIDSNSVADWAALAELLGLTITDDDIDEETGEIKDSVISAIISGLMAFVGSLLGTSLDDIISISDVTELGTTGIRMLSALVDLLISLNSSFKFQVINSLLSPLQGVMLNNDTPSDLTFNFNYGGVSRSITILPASLLTDSFFANALFIVRTLVSFILLYNWLKWARSFFASSV